MLAQIMVYLCCTWMDRISEMMDLLKIQSNQLAHFGHIDLSPNPQGTITIKDRLLLIPSHYIVSNET